MQIIGKDNHPAPEQLWFGGWGVKRHIPVYKTQALASIHHSPQYDYRRNKARLTRKALFLKSLHTHPGQQINQPKAICIGLPPLYIAIWDNDKNSTFCGTYAQIGIYALRQQHLTHVLQIYQPSFELQSNTPLGRTGALLLWMWTTRSSQY